jgi:hypothetical protein
MNDDRKVVVNVVLSELYYFVPARLLCERSPWFSTKVDERGELNTVVFAMAKAPTFETMLGFRCTGILEKPLQQENELETVLEICMMAWKLRMEDLEWCAVGKLDDYFDTHPGLSLPQTTIAQVLRNTEKTSHLREWLVDHVADCLSTGSICAGSLTGLVTTAPEVATAVMISMQTTIIEVTNTLLNMDINQIERARGELMHWVNHDRNFETHK